MLGATSAKAWTSTTWCCRGGAFGKVQRASLRTRCATFSGLSRIRGASCSRVRHYSDCGPARFSDFASRMLTCKTELNVRQGAWRGKLQTTKNTASENARPIPLPLDRFFREYLKTWKLNPLGLLF